MTEHRRKTVIVFETNIGALHAAIFQNGREERIYRGKKVIKVNL